MNTVMLRMPAPDQLVQSLPPELRDSTTSARLVELVQALSEQPVPTGRFRRGLSLGSLQVKLAIGYGVCAVR